MRAWRWNAPPPPPRSKRRFFLPAPPWPAAAPVPCGAGRRGPSSFANPSLSETCFTALAMIADGSCGARGASGPLCGPRWNGRRKRPPPAAGAGGLPDGEPGPRPLLLDEEPFEELEKSIVEINCLRIRLVRSRHEHDLLEHEDPLGYHEILRCFTTVGVFRATLDLPETILNYKQNTGIPRKCQFSP